MNLIIETPSTPAKSDLQTVRDGLTAYNIEQVPALAQNPQHLFNVYMRLDGDIVAGAICELNRDYLYVDTLWTSEQVRGMGYGSRIMHAAERYAIQRGIRQAYLMTTTFQARPFYEKLGYTMLAAQADRPQGHALCFMHKQDAVAPDPDNAVIIEAPPQETTTTTLEQGLLGEIAKYTPLTFDTVAVFLRRDDPQRTVVGGMIGLFYWDWLDLRQMWIDAPYRRQGWGTQLLARMNVLVNERGALGITTDVADFQALGFFQHHGFDLVATMPDSPAGYQHHFIERRR